MKITEIYTHVSKKDLGRIVSPLDSLFEKENGGASFRGSLPVRCLSASVLAQAGTQTGICKPCSDITPNWKDIRHCQI